MLTFTNRFSYLLCALLTLFYSNVLLAQTPIVHEYQKELSALDAEAGYDELYLDVDQDVSVMRVPSYRDSSTNRFIEPSLRIYEKQGSRWVDVFNVSMPIHGISYSRINTSPVAVDQGVVAVGNLTSKAVHVYEKQSGNWQQITKIRPPVSIMNDYINFGLKVAISDNIIAAHATTAAANPRRHTLHIFSKIWWSMEIQNHP